MQANAKRCDTSPTRTSGWATEADRVVHRAVVAVANTVIGQGADRFTRSVSSSVALLDLVLDAELRVVAVQRAEAIVEAHQAVSGPERGLVVGTTTFSRPTIGSRPHGLALPVLRATRFSGIDF